MSARTPRQREKAKERLVKAQACFELRWDAFNLFMDDYTETEVGLRLGFGSDPQEARDRAHTLKLRIRQLLAPLEPEGTAHDDE